MDSLTLVTGYWPQKHELVRSGQVYVRLFEELLVHLDGRLPVVVRADPSVEDGCRALAARWPDRVIVDPLPYESLKYPAQRARFEQLSPAGNSFMLRDTLEYSMLVWSKFDVVLGAAHTNPFNTSHFGWIDFGIPHVSTLQGVDWNEVEAESTRSDRIRICERMATSPSEVEEPFYFYSTNSARIAGGFLTGTREGLEQLVELFDGEIARMEKTGTYVLEEQILAAATALKPDLFEKWYANYMSVLTNVRHIKYDAGFVIENLRNCRDQELWENGRDIAEVLLSSANAYHHLLPEECFHLLDCGLQCALRTDADLAERLAKTALSLFHYSRVGRGMMKGTWRKSIQESLAHYNLDFSKKPWTWEEFAAQPDFRVWLVCF